MDLVSWKTGVISAVAGGVLLTGGFLFGSTLVGAQTPPAPTPSAPSQQTPAPNGNEPQQPPHDRADCPHMNDGSPSSSGASSFSHGSMGRGGRVRDVTRY